MEQNIKTFTTSSEIFVTDLSQHGAYALGMWGLFLKNAGLMWGNVRRRYGKCGACVWGRRAYTQGMGGGGGGAVCEGIVGLTCLWFACLEFGVYVQGMCVCEEGGGAACGKRGLR